MKPTLSKKKKISNTRWHQKCNTIEDAQLSFFKTADQAIKNDERQENEEGSNNTIFSQYIASDIDLLPEKFQRIARHEINNVLL